MASTRRRSVAERAVVKRSKRTVGRKEKHREYGVGQTGV
jgi:hypothetical protein